MTEDLVKKGNLGSNVKSEGLFKEKPTVVLGQVTVDLNTSTNINKKVKKKLFIEDSTLGIAVTTILKRKEETFFGFVLDTVVNWKVEEETGISIIKNGILAEKSRVLLNFLTLYKNI